MVFGVDILVEDVDFVRSSFKEAVFSGSDFLGRLKNGGVGGAGGIISGDADVKDSQYNGSSIDNATHEDKASLVDSVLLAGGRNVQKLDGLHAVTGGDLEASLGEDVSNVNLGGYHLLALVELSVVDEGGHQLGAAADGDEGVVNGELLEVGAFVDGLVIGVGGGDLEVDSDSVGGDYAVAALSNHCGDLVEHEVVGEVETDLVILADI